MTAAITIETVGQRLFRDEELGAYAVLDGASIPGLRQVLYERQPEHVCLFEGDLEPDMEEVAPYLVRLEPGSDFVEWVLGEGWGRHWGVFALADQELAAMSRHFRGFLIVYDTEGNPLRFRYYDPRVLRVYLPTCTPGELATVFGPVATYLLEGESPATLLQFRVASGALRREEVAIPLG
jgi:hypothetical protein